MKKLSFFLSLFFCCSISTVVAQPTLTTPIPDIIACNDELPYIINLNNHFSGADGFYTYTDNYIYYSYMEGTNLVLVDYAQTAKADQPKSVASYGLDIVHAFAYDFTEQSTEDIFNFEVVNCAPKILSSIPDQTLPFGNIVQINLSETFGDPDEDNFSINLGAHNTSIIDAFISDNILVIQAVGYGSTNVQILANDGINPSTQLFFNVTVPNDPPNIITTLSPRTIPQVGGSASYFFNEIFSDPEGDPLTFTAVSSNNAIATTSVNQGAGEVTINPVSPGTVTITLRAQDPYNPRVATTVSITVNGTPVVNSPIDDFILPVGDTRNFNLNTIFSDPEGANMTFTASSNNQNAVTTSIVGNTLFVNAVDLGNATVSVRANDNVNPVVTETFFVSTANDPPMLANSFPTIMVDERESVSINLNDHFTDPEGNPLTFQASAASNSIATVGLNNTTGVLMLTGNGIGTTTITVRAKDAFHDFISTTFTFVSNGNPTITNPILDFDLSINGIQNIGLGTIFSDPEGQGLSFEVLSSNPAVVRATLNGSTLTLQALDYGQSTISVNARDALGKTVTSQIKGNVVEEFVVSVINSAPTVTQTVANSTRAPNISFTLNLDEHFSDPDEDPLVYSAFSSNNSAVQVSIDENILTLTTGTQGTSSIEVVATDPLDTASSLFFSVTINRAPRLSNAINTISLFVPGPNGIFTQNLAGVNPLMIDPEESTITYSIFSNSNAGVASATITNANLSVNAVTLGTTQVTIRGTDAFGNSLDHIVAVSVEADNPPVPTTPPVTTKPQFTGIPIVSQINDDRGVASATLFFRRGNEDDFSFAQMSRTSGDAINGTYSAQIFGTFAGISGIEYFIEATDISGSVSRTDMQFIPILVDNILVPIESLGIGSSQNNYRIFSSPIALNQTDANTLFEPFLGEYDKNNWRFLSFAPNLDRYFDLSEGAINVTSGSAFWLLSKDAPSEDINLGSGITNNTSVPFMVTLQPGWNLVGTPFFFSLSSSQVFNELDGLIDIIGFDNSYFVASTLEPFSGYFVANNSESTQPLYFDAHNFGGEFGKEQRVKQQADLEWKIGIEARSRISTINDLYNFVGVAPEATNDYDTHDYPEPPAFGDFVSVSFDRTSWNKPLKKYRSDIRKSAEEGYTWEFNVETNTNAPINLTFTSLEEVPNSFEIFLVDELTDTAQNLRENDHYVVSSTEVERTLKLVVGDKNYLSTYLKRDIPENYALEVPFPNPARSAVTIPFALPESGEVNLHVYNILGQEVSQLLVNEQREAGRHALVWEQAQTLPSGTYLCRISVNGFTQTQKILLVK